MDSDPSPDEVPLSPPSIPLSEDIFGDDLNLEAPTLPTPATESHASHVLEESLFPTERKPLESSAAVADLEIRLVPKAKAKPATKANRKTSGAQGITLTGRVPTPRMEEHKEQIVLSSSSASSLAHAHSAPSNLAHMWLGKGSTEEAAMSLAVVTHDPEQLGLPVVQNGFANQVPGARAVVAAAVLGCAMKPGDERREIGKLIDYFLGPGHSPLVSLEALALVTGIDRKRLPSLWSRCASALNILGRCRLSLAEETLLETLPRDALVHYVEAVQYDETELQTRILGDASTARPLPSSSSSSNPGSTLALSKPSTAMVAFQTKGALSVYSSQAKQRIMQTQTEAAMVVRLGDKLVTILFRAATPLDVLDNVTAVCIKEQQLRCSKIGRAAIAFQGVTRAATTDAHKSNIACEASISKARAVSNHHSLHVLCDVHRTALVFNKTLAALDCDISAVIRIAKTLRTGGAMTRFRNCVKHEVANRLVILHGTPPREAMVYKQNVLKAFASHGSGALVRRALLALCANGDWRSRQIEFYVRPGSSSALQERPAILEHVTNGLVIALASSQPAMYNRSKWTGSDLAIDDLAIFECVHRLLSTAYARFCAGYMSGPRRVKLLAMGEKLAGYDRRGEPTGAEGQGDMDIAVEEPNLAIVPVAGEQAEEGQRANDSNDQSNIAEWAKLNAADRDAGMKFLSQDPLAKFVLIRFLMEPLRQYMTKQLDRASETWSFKEKAKLARALLLGTTYKHKLRIVEAALGADDQSFYEALRILFEATDLWSILPPSGRTMSMRCLAFRCASRMGCAFDKLLRSRHKGFPARLFLLLHDAGLAREFRELPECLLDPWSRSMRAQWPSLEGDEFMQVLYTVAITLRVDTSHLEARHASIRRVLVKGSVQTHSVSFPFLSAQWCFQQFRTLQKRHSNRCAPKKKASASGATKQSKGRKKVKRSESEQKPKRSGFGGAWRAWVRKHALNTQFEAINMTALAEEYTTAKEKNTAEYMEAERLGQAATDRGRQTGKHGFGGSTRMCRNVARNLVRLYNLTQSAHALENKGEAALRLVNFSLASGSSVSETIAMARSSQRLCNKASRTEEDRLQTSLAEFERGAGAAALATLRQQHPEIASLPLTAEPTNFGVQVRLDQPTEQDIQNAVEWANRNAHKSALASRLEHHWGNLHKLITTSESGDNEDGIPQETKCYQAGICLCSESGTALQQRAHRFLHYMKLLSSTRPNFKRDLGDGFLVVRLIGMSDDYDTLMDDDAGITDLWLHIGLMYWSPYEPGFMVVKPVDDPGETQPHERRVYLSSTHDFRLLFQAFEPFSAHPVILAKWYRLEDVARPTLRFAAQLVPALRLQGFEEAQQFWPRRRPTRSGGARRDHANRRSDDQDTQMEAIEDEVPAEVGPPPPEDGDHEPEFQGLLESMQDLYEEPVDMALFVGEDERTGERPSVDGGDAAAVALAPVDDPPPPPQPAIEPKRRRRQGGALDMTVGLPGGVLQFYCSNGNFEAKCTAHYDERCSLTRAGAKAGQSAEGSASRGRPLGLLAAWLSLGVACDSKEAHKSPDIIKRLCGPEGFEHRKTDRESLGTMPGSAVLFENERPRRADEGEEPNIVL